MEGIRQSIRQIRENLHKLKAVKKSHPTSS
jgi:hypothetical protein